MFGETLERYPKMEVDGEPVMAESRFVNQMKTLRFMLGAREA
jgi:hypothetical protein